MATLRPTVVLALLAFAVLVATDVLGILASSPDMAWPSGLLANAAVLSTGGVGLLIGLRHPGHRVGLLLAGGALAIAANGLAQAYGVYAVLEEPGTLPAGRVAVLWADASWPFLFAAITAVAFVFPDGHLPSRRWRPVAVVATLAFLGTTIMSLFSSEPFEAPFAAVERPLPAYPSALEALRTLFLVAMLASLVAAALAVRARYRRATPVERLQVLWLAYVAWLIPAAIVLCLLDGAITGEQGVLTFAAATVPIVAVPAAIGVAILRYRLYDIDLLVNRTLVYGGLTACVLALYVAVVFGVGSLLSSRGSLGLALVVTAVVAVAAQPLRAFLQRQVDRLLYGDRNDPYTGLSRLADRLQASVEPQAALRSIVEAVADALRLPFVAIDLFRDGTFERAEQHGRQGAGEQVEVQLTSGGEVVGRLVAEGRGAGETLAPADVRLLHELARHAGGAVHAARLHADLQRSRERLVLAREEERRRIRRDLHDGLGPTLATAVFQVDAARDRIGSDPAGADAQLDRLRGALQQAVGDVRALVYALRPPALDELGLVPALREQAARLQTANGPRIAVDAPDELPQLPAAVEVAAFRIAVEAVTNSVRHSGAATCRVSLRVNGGLEVEIADDGCGRAGDRRAGVGTSSMHERAGELGATLTIEPRAGRGTRVHTVLPLEPA